MKVVYYQDVEITQGWRIKVIKVEFSDKTEATYTMSGEKKVFLYAYGNAKNPPRELRVNIVIKKEQDLMTMVFDILEAA